jgi:hypothetical protein
MHKTRPNTKSKTKTATENKLTQEDKSLQTEFDPTLQTRRKKIYEYVWCKTKIEQNLGT